MPLADSPLSVVRDEEGPATLPIIRKATKGDRDLFMTLWAKMGKELVGFGAKSWEIERKFIESIYLFDRYVGETLPGIVLLADWQHDVVGMSMFGADEGYTDGMPKINHCHALYVSSGHRKSGLSAHLVTTSTIYMSKYGFTYTIAEILVNNTPCLNLAKTLGYQMHSVIITKGALT